MAAGKARGFEPPGKGKSKGKNRSKGKSKYNIGKGKRRGGRGKRGKGKAFYSEDEWWSSSDWQGADWNYGYFAKATSSEQQSSTKSFLDQLPRTDESPQPNLAFALIANATVLPPVSPISTILKADGSLLIQGIEPHVEIALMAILPGYGILDGGATRSLIGSRWVKAYRQKVLQYLPERNISIGHDDTVFMGIGPSPERSTHAIQWPLQLQDLSGTPPLE